MGFVNNLLERTELPEQPPRSESLLIMLAMQLIARSSTPPKPVKIDLLRHLFQTLQSLERNTIEDLQAQVQALIEQHAEAIFATLDKADMDDIPSDKQDLFILNVLLRATEELRGLRRRQAREQCFALAVELALVGGRIGNNDDHLLSKMYEVLGIDREVARKIVSVFQLKYSFA